MHEDIKWLDEKYWEAAEFAIAFAKNKVEGKPKLEVPEPFKSILCDPTGFVSIRVGEKTVDAHVIKQSKADHPSDFVWLVTVAIVDKRIRMVQP